MKNFYVETIHKCGTCIQNKIFKYISSLKKVNFYMNHQNLLEKQPFIKTSRLIMNEIKDNSFKIIIIRHPIDRLISQYYSFGYTHPTGAHWIKNPIERNKISKQLINQKKEIQKMSIDEYIIKNIEDRNEKYMITYKLKNNKNTIVIPYEFMIFKFKKFCDIIGKVFKINSETIFSKFKHEFVDFKDKSDDIIKGKSRTHKRTRQFKEYKTKLSKETIDFLEKNHIEKINQYDNLLNEYFN